MTTPFDDNIDMQDEEDSAGDATTADDQFRKLQQERDSLYERLARATADYQNSGSPRNGDGPALQYANASLIKSLLPVIDNFERAWPSISPRRIQRRFSRDCRWFTINGSPF